MTKEEACKLLGCADSELLNVLDSPGGTVFHMADGTAYIDVPTDAPDAEGKTGLMFVAAPIVNNDYGWQGDFPVFANPVETPQTAVRDLGINLDGMDKDQLLDHARTLGIDVKGTWGPARILEAILAAVPESDTRS